MPLRNSLGVGVVTSAVFLRHFYVFPALNIANRTATIEQVVNCRGQIGITDPMALARDAQILSYLKTPDTELVLAFAEIKM